MTKSKGKSKRKDDKNLTTIRKKSIDSSPPSKSRDSPQSEEIEDLKEKKIKSKLAKSLRKVTGDKLKWGKSRDKIKEQNQDGDDSLSNSGRVEIESEVSQERSEKVRKDRKTRKKSKKKIVDEEKGPSEDSEEEDLQHDGDFSETFDQNVDQKKEKVPSSALLSYDSKALISRESQSQGVIWNLVINKSPVQRSNKEWLEWIQLIYYPSTNPVPIGEKLNLDLTPRYLEDEGIYVESPLRISKRNLNRLENRILMENCLLVKHLQTQMPEISNWQKPYKRIFLLTDCLNIFYDFFEKSGWFGENGQLLSLPDPYRPEPMQILGNFYNPNNQGKVSFVPAKVDDYFQNIQFDSKTGYELILDFGSVQFVHHHLFSKEHVLASKLERNFQKYAQRQIGNESDKFENKIKALRVSLAGIKRSLENLENEQMEKSEISQANQKLVKFREILKQTRSLRDRAYLEDKQAFSTVLDDWKKLKVLRKEQGYTNTSLKLNVNKFETNPDQDRINMSHQIQMEISDLREEFELKHSKKLSKIREKKKRHKSKDLEEKSSDDESSIYSKDQPRFNENDAKEFAIKKFRDFKRGPGEPIVNLELSRNTPVTQIGSLPVGSEKEINRRKSLQKIKVELRIGFNKREIYRSEPREINQPEFSINFEISIPISINEYPESLQCELYEVSGLSKNQIDEIEVSFPNSKTSIERSKMEQIEFNTEKIVKIQNNDGVGCGNPFIIMGNAFEGLFTSGFIKIRTGWAQGLDGTILYPKGLEKNEEIRESQDLNLHLIDPNNPKHVHFIQRGSEDYQKDQILAQKVMIIDKSQRFSLDSQMAEFDFCSMEMIENNLRFKLIQLRDEGVPEFRGIKFIPPNEHDILPKIFEEYEKRLNEEQKSRLGGGPSEIESKGWRSQLSHHEELLFNTNRMDRLKEMRKGVLQLFQSHLKQLTFEDIVSEEQIPDIGTLGLNIMSLFQPRRPLRPTRKERKRVQGFALIDTKINLIVNIVRAFNLPTRKDTDLNELSTEALTGIQIRPSNKRLGVSTSGNYSSIKPFVEIWFQRTTTRTTTALGSNPTWNQELQLDLTLQDDSQIPESLSQLDDFIYLLVYDEVAVDLLEDDRRRETDIYQRLEKRWLGSITIPFSTLYTNGRIEGTFKINSPSILLGYEAQGMASHFGPQNLQNVSKNDKNLPISNQKCAYITLFIALHPAVHPSQAIKEDCASGEPLDILSHVKGWRNSYQKKFPDRSIQPLVMTSDGDTILSTRFLKPIKPPEMFLETSENLMNTLIQLAHYVSLFPSIRDSTLGITDYNLWFTSDVFVMTPGGGIGDHAVLLCCFFLYLKIPCWIVQGNAIPDGRTSFVLTSFKGIESDYILKKSLKNAILIWNPCTGEHYQATDSFCPLQKVWAVVGHNNIWANISKDSERPHQIDWEIGKSKQWSNCFSKGFAETKLITVQPQTIKFKRPDQNQANSLAQRIERHLKDTFMKWRKTERTNWNRYCSSILRRLLPKLEEIKSGHFESTLEAGQLTESSVTIQSSGSQFNLNDEHLDELREITSTYQMIGFPLHQAYTNMDSIDEVVFATGLHTIDTPNLEFGIAAYAESFPANVYSIWIYVAALHKRK